MDFIDLPKKTQLNICHFYLVKQENAAQFLYVLTECFIKI